MSPTRKFAAIAPFFGKRVYVVISEELGGADWFRERVMGKTDKTYGTYRTYMVVSMSPCVWSTHCALS